MLRAHKIRLNPTLEQELYFRKATGNARFAWNWALAIIKEAGANQAKLPSVNALRIKFNQIKRIEFPFMLETTKCAPDQALLDLKQALSNFFNGLKKRKAGKKRKDGHQVNFPRFKSRRKGFGSFYLANDQFAVKGYEIKIPKLGWVNMTEQLRFAGKLMSARISERAGYWFVSILVEMPELISQAPERVIGIDVGIKTLAVDSDGEGFENQKHFSLAQKKLRRLSRWLARKQKGRKNWAKAKLKLARWHLRIANLRKDTLHKMPTSLAQKASTIALETLNVPGMLKNHKLAKAISDASFAEIARQLTYKAQQVVLVAPFYPSSKICNGCGVINKALPLAHHQWQCPSCGATLNIRDEGIRIIGA